VPKKVVGAASQPASCVGHLANHNTTHHKFKQSIFNSKIAHETLGETRGGNGVAENTTSSQQQIITNSYSSSSSSSGYMSKSSGSSLTSGSLLTSPLSDHHAQQPPKSSSSSVHKTSDAELRRNGPFMKRTLSNSMLDQKASKDSFANRNETSSGANMMYRAGSDCSIYNPPNSNSLITMVTFFSSLCQLNKSFHTFHILEYLNFSQQKKTTSSSKTNKFYPSYRC
jgi:hypothetical protein